MMNTLCPDCTDKYPTSWYYRRWDWEFDQWKEPLGSDNFDADMSYHARLEGSGCEWAALPIVRSCLTTEVLPMAVAAGFLDDWIAEITRLANA